MKKIMVALCFVLFAAVCVAPSMAADIPVTCKDCGSVFHFTEKEQMFYKEKGFGNMKPDRCPDCRQKRKNPKRGIKPATGDRW
jgi:hypothetical protein